jgi:hypothetical protein
VYINRSRNITGVATRLSSYASFYHRHHNSMYLRPFHPSILSTRQAVSQDADAGTADNIFSQANLFGLYLTIAICLLAQPQGTLLYIQPRNFVGRCIFFFWRLNPLACAAEVMLVLLALVDSVRFAALQSRSATSAKATVFWKSLRLSAAAICLLRCRGKTSTRHLVNEALNTKDTTLFLDPSDVSQFLGPGGSAQTVLNLTSSAGALFTIIKLAFVSIPIQLRLSASFMIASWSSIQVLSLLSTSKDLDPEAMLDRTGNLLRLVDHPGTWSAITIPLLPLFVHFGLAFFHKLVLAPMAPKCILSTLALFGFGAMWVLLEAYIKFLPLYSIILGVLDKLGPIYGWILAIVRSILFVSCYVYVANTVMTSIYTSQVNDGFYYISLLFVPFGILNLFLLPGFQSFPKHRRVSDRSRCFGMLFNLVEVGAVFAAAIELYDENDSYKPAWIEWLG